MLPERIIVQEDRFKFNHTVFVSPPPSSSESTGKERRKEKKKGKIQHRFLVSSFFLFVVVLLIRLLRVAVGFLATSLLQSVGPSNHLGLT